MGVDESVCASTCRKSRCVSPDGAWLNFFPVSPAVALTSVIERQFEGGVDGNGSGTVGSVRSLGLTDNGKLCLRLTKPSPKRPTEERERRQEDIYHAGKEGRAKWLQRILDSVIIPVVSLLLPTTFRQPLTTVLAAGVSFLLCHASRK